MHKDCPWSHHALRFKHCCFPTVHDRVENTSLLKEQVEMGWEGKTSACFYYKNVCPFKWPRVELVERVNKGGDGYAGFSFSFSCTNDVVPDHSCFTVAGVQVGATADCTRAGSQGMPKTRRKKRRQGTYRGWGWGEGGGGGGGWYSYKIQLPKLPKSWIQYSIENFPLNTWLPAWVEYWCGSYARAPQLDSFEILRQFHAVFSRNAWTRKSLELFPETGDMASVT